jgi:hypothetical protein
LLKNNALISFLGVFAEISRREIDDNRAISAGINATGSASLSSSGEGTGGTPAHPLASDEWRAESEVRGPNQGADPEDVKNAG